MRNTVRQNREETIITVRTLENTEEERLTKKCLKYISHRRENMIKDKGGIVMDRSDVWGTNETKDVWGQ